MKHRIISGTATDVLTEKLDVASNDGWQVVSLAANDGSLFVLLTKET